jgi:hypothetical protein
MMPLPRYEYDEYLINDDECYCNKTVDPPPQSLFLSLFFKLCVVFFAFPFFYQPNLLLFFPTFLLFSFLGVITILSQFFLLFYDVFYA